MKTAQTALTTNSGTTNSLEAQAKELASSFSLKTLQNKARETREKRAEELALWQKASLSVKLCKKADSLKKAEEREADSAGKLDSFDSFLLLLSAAIAYSRELHGLAADTEELLWLEEAEEEEEELKTDTEELLWLEEAEEEEEELKTDTELSWLIASAGFCSQSLQQQTAKPALLSSPAVIALQEKQKAEAQAAQKAQAEKTAKTELVSAKEAKATKELVKAAGAEAAEQPKTENKTEEKKAEKAVQTEEQKKAEKAVFAPSGLALVFSFTESLSGKLFVTAFLEAEAGKGTNSLVSEEKSLKALKESGRLQALGLSESLTAGAVGRGLLAVAWAKERGLVLASCGEGGQGEKGLFDKLTEEERKAGKKLGAYRGCFLLLACDKEEKLVQAVLTAEAESGKALRLNRDKETAERLVSFWHNRKLETELKARKQAEAQTATEESKQA